MKWKDKLKQLSKINKPFFMKYKLIINKNIKIHLLKVFY